MTAIERHKEIMQVMKDFRCSYEVATDLVYNRYEDSRSQSIYHLTRTLENFKTELTVAKTNLDADLARVLG